MAFQARNLSVLAYANGFTLWHYTSADAAASIDTEGYFNDAAEMLRVGDMVIANTSTDTTPTGGLFLVNKNTGGMVDVADITQVGASDTD
ncbi:hypothetical protein [Ferruginivarius sediminum]|uniref:Uncharacterized protein n=1 Tax=Ferruginivarius sediminum TaxID=2661937 RepID=A0A369T715_9PROT|nr:hypothetical protein [Ferruginivarius sediminum]RDD61068.1 hypothetical protein DRB17_15205 [Ferruginivarius sediminum]